MIQKLPARYRLGVSATWRRRDGLDDLWKWHLGDVEAKGIRPILPASYYQFQIDLGLNDAKFVRFERINHSAMITAISESDTLNDRLIKEITVSYTHLTLPTIYSV